MDPHLHHYERAPAGDNSEDKERLLFEAAGENSSDDHVYVLPAGYVPRRYIFVVLSFIGATATYMLRSNLSTAIIPMAAQFGWSKTDQGAILSAFFIGYVVGQLPGGVLTLRFGGSTVFLVGIFVTAVLTLLTPIAALGGVSSLMALRIVQGFVEGGIYPAMHTMISMWALPSERSLTTASVYSGNYLGTALGLGLTGAQLSDNGLSPTWAWARIGGGSSCWPAAFYVQGIAVCAWAVLWRISVFSSPAVHPSIHPAERKLIEASRPPAPPPTLASIRAIPWWSIIYNVPFLAVVANHFFTNFCNYILMSWSTTFIKEELHTPIDAAGILGLLPYLAAWIVAIGGGFVADWLILTRRATITTVRKAWQCSALCGCAGLLVGLGYLTDSTVALVVLTAAVGSLGLTESGYHGNHCDIFPTHAGIAFALTNIVGNMGGVVGPALVGRIIDTSSNPDPNANPSAEQWRTVFYMCAATNVAGAVVWALFASGKRQL